VRWRDTTRSSSPTGLLRTSTPPRSPPCVAGCWPGARSSRGAGGASPSPAPLDASALAAVRGWVLAGGTLVAWRGRGLAVARAAGVTGATLAAPALGARLGGTALEITGAGAPAAAVVDDDAAVQGATAVARYADGSAAATDDRVGAGRVLLLGFDPAFRAGTPGATALLSRLLLASGGAR